MSLMNLYAYLSLYIGHPLVMGVSCSWADLSLYPHPRSEDQVKEKAGWETENQNNESSVVLEPSDGFLPELHNITPFQLSRSSATLSS